MMIACLKCTGCGAEYAPDSLMNLCPVDGRPVEIIIDLKHLASSQPDAAWYDPGRTDLWRFGGLLPLDINDDRDRPHIIPLGEGHTPVLDFNNHPTAGNLPYWERGAAWALTLTSTTLAPLPGIILTGIVLASVPPIGSNICT